MALVILLKGINVGGHRSFRPSVLAKELARFDVVNIGATGTFVIRNRVGRTKIRAEILRRLPFDADVMICSGRDILRLVDRNPFKGQPAGPDTIRFVSVLAKRPRRPSRIPLDIPAVGDWCVRVLACQDRFVLGMYRRQMKAIGCLGQLEKLFGARATTRNWNTILAIAQVLRLKCAA